MHSPPHRRTRWFAAVMALAMAAPLLSWSPAGAAPSSVSGGALEWGVHAPFRNYVESFIAQGTVTTHDGASAGPGAAFTFPASSGAVDGEEVEVAFAGSVRFVGHSGQLDLTIRSPRVEVSGTSGTLVVDVESLQLGSDEVEHYPGTPFADLDLTSVIPTATAGGLRWDAVPATLTAEGAVAFAGFYPQGQAIDPVSFELDLAPARAPSISVSSTTSIDPAGETVTVAGAGFDPAANTGTRPPLAGQPAGVYVVFAKVADPWRPSAGAGSSARQVISQRWALPQASYDALNPSGTNPAFVLLQEDGTFETTLDLAPAEGPGRYAVITFAGGGAVNPDHELETPMSFAVGSISGTIVDSTGAPAPDVEVTTAIAGDLGSARSTTTAADGTYMLDELPLAASWIVSARSADGVTACHGTTTSCAPTTRVLVTTTEGGTATDVDIALPASTAGTLDGAVVDTDQAPVSGAPVLVVAANWSNVSLARTDSDGAFAVAGLPAGNYFVAALGPAGVGCATGCGWGAQPTIVTGEGPGPSVVVTVP